MPQTHSLPLVLAVGGHDPCGGAGLQADLEAIAANGCQALSVITALTCQTSCGVRQVLPQPAVQVLDHCLALFEDSPVAAIKLGLLGQATTAGTLAGLLGVHPGLPAVLDPVLHSGGGLPLADAALRTALVKDLAPRCTLMTPNTLEARALSGQHQLRDCAAALTEGGCPAVLITGTHDPGDQVVHRLYDADELLWEGAWERLPGEFHGSGCTLASAAAAGLALGKPLLAAVTNALDYSWHCLARALVTGHCQLTPNRFYRFRP